MAKRRWLGFWSGVASIGQGMASIGRGMANIGGFGMPERQELEHHEPGSWRDDAAAVANDYAAVAADLRIVMNELEATMCDCVPHMTPASPAKHFRIHK